MSSYISSIPTKRQDGLIENVCDLPKDFHVLRQHPLPRKILMVSPEHFNVDRPLNAHMTDEHGRTHTVDKEKAYAQWAHLKSIYEKLQFTVEVLPGVPQLPDMVFCANQSFPFISEQGEYCAVLSNMADDIRHREVPYIENFLKAKGYNTVFLPARSSLTRFESMGDALWLGRLQFILGGFGLRTHPDIYKILAARIGCPIAIFELKEPRFYHLDTCLSILDSTTALACAEAFTPQGLKLLQAIFKNLLLVPLKEADSPGFACNAHCPDEKHVILQQGNTVTNALLEKNGFVPIEIETGEFIKSGGSVFCMKLAFF